MDTLTVYKEARRLRENQTFDLYAQRLEGIARSSSLSVGQKETELAKVRKRIAALKQAIRDFEASYVD